MTSIAQHAPSPLSGIVGGVDTHKERHAAAAALGRLLGAAEFPATGRGCAELPGWLRGFGPLRAVGTEGTGCWGKGLARHLSGEGVEVVGLDRPDRRRRRRGRSDPVDAGNAARAVLAGEAAGTPETADGPVEAIRMLGGALRSAVKARTQTVSQLHALATAAPEPARGPPAGLRNGGLVTACAVLDAVERVEGPHSAARFTLARLARLARRADRLDDHIAALTGEFGVGVDTAAALPADAGDNPGRLGGEACYAALCGVSPVEASSGRTVRRRLNRGGGRQADNALWRIVIVHMAHHQPTRDYVTRRTAEGLSRREIIRCLKRYLARRIHCILRKISAPEDLPSPA